MNRKLVKGLLLLSVATVGCGTFTSCKDTDEDFNTGIIAGQVDLADKIKALQTAVDNIKQCTCPDVNALINNLRTELKNEIANGDQANLAKINANVQAIAALQGDLAAVKTVADKAAADLLTLDAKVNGVDAKVDQLRTLVNNSIATLTQTLTAITNDVASLKTDVATIKTNLTNVTNDLSAVKVDLSNVKSEVASQAVQLIDHEARITALENLKTEFPTIKDNVQDLTTWMNENKQKYDQAVADVTGALSDIDALQGAVERNSSLISQLQSRVEAYFSDLMERLNKLITGILVNQTYNPIFGTINLPIGMQSIVLANYYGYTQHPVNFPMDFNHEAYSAQDALAGLGIENVVTKLKNKPVVIDGGDKYMDEDTNNLGQLYLTINPNNVAFDGVKLDLVKSTGDKAPISLTTKSTDEELTFGWTRSDVKNGFYRSEAYIKPDDAPSILVNIEPGLKSAAKNLIKNPSKSTVADFGKILIDQLDGFLPAYAVRATWNADETQADGSKKAVEYAVYSKYEVAATAFRPLGYESLSDVSTSRELPTFDPVTEYLDRFFNDLRDDVKIELDFSKINGLDSVKLDLNVNIKELGFKVEESDIVVHIPALKIEGDYGTSYTEPQDITLGYHVGEGLTGNAVALNPLITNIQDAVDKMLKDLDKEINEQLQGQINKQINDQLMGQVDKMVQDINNMLVGDGTAAHPGINGQINNQVSEILDKIQNQLAGKLGKLDKLVDKYNALANRVNKFLKNPNHYLQVAMAYSDGAGDLHMVSNNKYVPSTFKRNGGNGLELFTTSLTGDLGAPSFKKWVAVVNAYDPSNNMQKVAPSVVDKANESANLNKVLPGRQQRVAVDASKLESGLVYEIVYSSLDYRGSTSTRVFYLTVKD